MSLSDDADFPACPDCETNVFVGRSSQPAKDWHCYRCESAFLDHEIRRRPVRETQR